MTPKDQMDPAAREVSFLNQLNSNQTLELAQSSEILESIEQIREVTQQILQQVPSLDLKCLADSFEAKFPDRDQLKHRYLTDNLFVKSWRDTSQESSPIRCDSLVEFFNQFVTPWVGSRAPDIQLRLFNTQFQNNKLAGTVVAEIYGQLDNGYGIQATSVWEATWTRTNDEVELASIRVTAHEESSMRIPGGKMLIEATEKVFGNCQGWKEQLKFGLDDWAQSIPLIDISGHHGLAVGDVNGDGRDDVYVCQPHGLPNRLFVQQPNGRALDHSRASQLDVLDESRAALIVDLDNDHDQDLVISTDENLLLFSNLGNATFQLERKLTLGCNAHSVISADFDNDGDLDLFVCKHTEINRQADVVIFPDDLNKGTGGGRNILLRNDEGWIFSDVTQSVGISSENNYFTRSAAWHDYDRDGDQDLFIANEHANLQVYENQEGWFDEISDRLGEGTVGKTKSVSIGEFNADGILDVFVACDKPTNAYRHRLDSENVFKQSLLGNSRIWFGDSPNSAKRWRSFEFEVPVLAAESAQGSLAADINNDGFDDLLISNGYITAHHASESAPDSQLAELLYFNLFAERTERLPERLLAKCAQEASRNCRAGLPLTSPQFNRCFLGLGQKGLLNFSAASGFGLPGDARAIAYSDWDGDGDLDLFFKQSQWQSTPISAESD